MSYIARMMSTGEDVKLVTRQHWITIGKAIVIYGVLFLGFVLLSGVGIGSDAWLNWGSRIGYLSMVLAAVMLVLLFVTITRWYYRQFVVTTRRVMQVAGVLNRTVSDTNLDKVNDVVLTQPLLGRMLGYGSIKIISGSDVGVDTFERIRDPMGFKRVMLDNKEDFDTLFQVARGSQEPDATTLLGELAALRDQGVVSPEEYEIKKAEILARM